MSTQYLGDDSPPRSLGSDGQPRQRRGGLIDRTLKGEYTLYRLVGRGAFGEVYLAQTVSTGAVVAVKALDSRYLSDVSMLARFKREAELARRLDHPNIVRMLDFGEEDDVCFLVMEFVQGRTLAKVIEDRGRLSVSETAAVGIQALQALQYAHAQRVVHRDIKPHNLMLTPDGALKVMDFGLARQDSLETLTLSGASLGTPHYMAPELFRGEPADIRSDLYALGITLYQCLSGQMPFDARSPYEMMTLHTTAPVPPLVEIRDDLPGAFASVIEYALAKQPQDRYQTPAEMLAALAPFGADGMLPSVASPPPQPASAQPLSSPQPAPASAQSLSQPQPDPASAQPQAVQPRPVPTPPDTGILRQLPAWAPIAAAALLLVVGALLFGPRLLSPEAPSAAVAPTSSALLAATQAPAAPTQPPAAAIQPTAPASAPTLAQAAASAPSPTAAPPTPLPVQATVAAPPTAAPYAPAVPTTNPAAAPTPPAAETVVVALPPPAPPSTATPAPAEGPPPTPLPAYAPADVLLADDFDDPRTGILPGSSGDSNSFTVEYVDGEYAIGVVDPQWHGIAAAWPSDELADATIAVDARIVGDDYHRFVVLICRFDDRSTTSYQLRVQPNAGTFTLLRIDQYDSTALVPWTRSPAINPGDRANHVELTCAGPNLSASINGATVATVQDATYTSGHWAIGTAVASDTAGTVDTRFDNLQIAIR